VGEIEEERLCTIVSDKLYRFFGVTFGNCALLGWPLKFLRVAEKRHIPVCGVRFDES
jgi:hypothetical protein